ncbi:MAG: manganese efflux pump MntP [Desulfitobacteriaceae bacterium]
MNLGWTTVVAVALGADAFSLALAIGLTGIGKKMIWRLTVVIAVFHVIMPLVGLFAGQTLGMFLGALAKAIGATLLIWLGIRMIVSIYKPKEQRLPLSNARELLKRGKLPRGISLEGVGIFALAISVSLDALSVGFSLGTLGSQIGWTVLIMGCVAGLMTMVGLLLGRILGTWVGERAELLGGLALIVIGLKILF